MKSTDNFKKTIKTHLDELAKTDKLFAVKYAADNKSLSECVQFILGEVRKSGNCAFSDDEVYGMAIHYYDESNLKIAATVGARVICPADLSALSPEDKEKAKDAAFVEYQQALKDKMLEDAQSRRTKKHSKKAEVIQPTLF